MIDELIVVKQGIQTLSTVAALKAIDGNRFTSVAVNTVSAAIVGATAVVSVDSRLGAAIVTSVLPGASSVLQAEITTLQTDVANLGATISAGLATVSESLSSSVASIHAQITTASNAATSAAEAADAAALSAASSASTTALAATNQAVAANSTAIAAAQSGLSGALGQIDTLQTSHGASTATFTSEIAALSTSTSQTAVTVTTLQTTVGQNTSAISQLQTTVVNGSQAISNDLLTLSATTNALITIGPNPPSTPATNQIWINSSNGNAVETWTSANGWQATRDVGIAANAAAITSEQTARQSADSSLSTRIDSVLAIANGNSAAISSNATTAANATQAVASNLSALQTNFNNQTSTFSNQIAGLSTAQTATATNLTNLTATVNGQAATISTNATTAATATQNVANNLTTLQSAYNTKTASYDQSISTLTSQASATATNLSNLTTTVSGNTSTLSVLQGSVNGLSAQYAVVGTIDGQTGGFSFSGMQKADGSGAVFTTEFNSNVVINGSLLVSGSIDASKLILNQMISSSCGALAPYAADFMLGSWATPARWTFKTSSFNGQYFTVGSGEAGFYLISAYVTTRSSVQGHYIGINQYSNGTTTILAMTDAESGSGSDVVNNIGVTGFGYLNVGDQLGVEYSQANAENGGRYFGRARWSIVRIEGTI